MDYLDDATVSTFKRSNIIKFGKYNSAQLCDIVNQRIELAFNPGVVEPEVPTLIGDIGQEYGDARYAIEVLEKAGQRCDGEKASKESSPLPEINFASFIFSLNSSALVHLGLVEEPTSGKKLKNLPLAKQTIDILGMLEEKTRGNLTDDEEKLLKNILHDLRIMYVKENK